MDLGPKMLQRGVLNLLAVLSVTFRILLKTIEIIEAH